jgi:hypothetical protein
MAFLFAPVSKFCLPATLAGLKPGLYI